MKPNDSKRDVISPALRRWPRSDEIWDILGLQAKGQSGL